MINTDSHQTFQIVFPVYLPHAGTFLIDTLQFHNVSLVLSKCNLAKKAMVRNGMTASSNIEQQQYRHIFQKTGKC